MAKFDIAVQQRLETNGTPDEHQAKDITPEQLGSCRAWKANNQECTLVRYEPGFQA